MGKKEKGVDAYISKAAPFAKPILEHYRDLVHKTCPDVEEKLKWGMPHFDYNGGPMTNMAAFKQHCAIGFWKASLMKDAELLTAVAKSETAMGHLGRITSLKDMPKDKVLVAWIKDAMRLNDEGIKLVTKKGPVKEIETPPELKSALAKNKKASKAFEAFPPSHRKEYNQWISEAKTDATREKRIATAIEWISEGKNRNWKYKK